MQLLIGIDGGGTKTEMVLCDETGAIQNLIRLGSSNPNDIGIEKCLETLRNGLDSLLEDFGGREEAVLSMFAGISGGTTGSYQQLLNDELKKMLPNARHVKNNSDAINALSSGVLHNDGCVVIAGTGTIGYARKGEEIYRIGGWGYLFDRGGSGYDLGRDAIYHALCDIDKRGKKTLITELLAKELGCSLPQALDEIYARGKRYIASLAPVVFAAFQQGDMVAQQIIKDNMYELSRLFNTIVALSNTHKIVLVGGVFERFNVLKRFLIPLLNSETEFIFPVMPPVFGAVVEAASGAGSDINPDFEKTWRVSYEMSYHSINSK